MARSGMARYARRTQRISAGLRWLMFASATEGLPIMIALDRSPQMHGIMQRHDASWHDYVTLRDSEAIDWQKIAFHQGWL
jgi:hypothetical protein